MRRLTGEPSNARTTRPRVRFLTAVLLSLGVVLFASSVGNAKTTIPPRPASDPIVDQMGILGQSAIVTLQELNQRLRSERSGAEIGVLIISTTSGEDPNAFATRAFNNWKLGSASLNNGALLMVAQTDRKVQLILGDGVDSASQVSQAQSIVSEYILPQFRKDDFESGVLIGAVRTATQILGLVDASGTPVDTTPFDAESTEFTDSGVTDPGGSESGDSGSAESGSGESGSNIPWFVGALGLTGAGAVGTRTALRRRPRRCQKCGARAVRLGELVDDGALDPSQRAEERVGSVDYDVWDCPACDGVEVLRYGKLFTKYKECPGCGSRTKIGKTLTVKSPTEYSTGLERIDETCANCSFKNSYTRVLARITRESSSSSSSSSFSSSSSSFSSSGSSGSSGGHSSGGGGGGSW